LFFPTAPFVAAIDPKLPGVALFLEQFAHHFEHRMLVSFGLNHTIPTSVHNVSTSWKLALGRIVYDIEGY
jgi:hypothetical protein